MSSSAKICERLLAAESESAVQAIVDEESIFSSGENWRPLDGRETNFNVTSNQASDGGKALTELMTNMVDAVLMKRCLEKGIDPKSRNAPATMYQAVDSLVKRLHGGKLLNLDPQDPWLREFGSRNLVIGITGAKNKKEGLPCFTFVDNGEGQSPGRFEKTFLSLSEGNKKDIPFVQGKYNMGSSGVLGYCGRKWFKLIVSRRFDSKTPWGWTLMRRRPGDGMPVAEYIVLPGGTIPSFEQDEVLPFRKQNGGPYERLRLQTGTIIKLYDYQVGARFLSFRGAREALNENLVETILPFRLLDFRQKPDSKRVGDRADGIDPRPFYGMEYLLLRSHREDEQDVEEDQAAGLQQQAVGSITDPELGHISISAIKLKRDIPSWLSSTNNRVFHAVNGQVQFKQTRGYLTECGYPALKDRVVVIINASNLTFGAHNDIWKGDREHVRSTIVGEKYRELVTRTIKDSQALREFQLQVAREEMDLAVKTERDDLFQKLVDADRNLAALLTDRDPVIRLPSSGSVDGQDSGAGKFEGKYSPTFLRVEERIASSRLDIPINRTRPIGCRTDAENGYLNRADNQGTLLFPKEIEESFSVRRQLFDGRFTVYLAPLEERVEVGSEFSFHIGLHDPAMPAPVETELITVRVCEEDVAPGNPGKNKKPNRGAGPKGPKPGSGSTSPTHGLPRYKLLTRDGRKIGDSETEKWPEGFNEQDGGAIKDLGDQGVIYLINYDNAYHLRYRQQQRGDVARDAVSEKFILGMRILMLGYEYALRGVLKGDSKGLSEFVDEFRRMSAKAAASTVLALAENLPKIIDQSDFSKDAE